MHYRKFKPNPGLAGIFGFWRAFPLQNGFFSRGAVFGEIFGEIL
jgi:hypothetical protein